jgi:cation:H+ antiporter
MLDWLLLLAGLALLAGGAEALVRGASRLASSLGVTPLVIGLTVVGCGTSMPEVVVSAIASANGEPAIALGNVLGSNIANSGLILAIAALILPMRCDMQLLRRDAPIMILVTIVVLALSWTGRIGRVEGLLMLAGLGAFVWLTLRWARLEPPAIEAEFAAFEHDRGWLVLSEPQAREGLPADTEANRRRLQRQRILHCIWIALGIALLVGGGHLLVESASALARRFGISDAVIAVTLVAVGTSLPELATSVVAALRREADISVGNIIGSNIFNLLGVLGLAAAIRPVPVPAAVRDFDLLWMAAFAAATALILRTGHKVTRLEGAALLAAYTVFVALLLR